MHGLHIVRVTSVFGVVKEEVVFAVVAARFAEVFELRLFDRRLVDGQRAEARKPQRTANTTSSLRRNGQLMGCGGQAFTSPREKETVGRQKRANDLNKSNVMQSQKT